MGTVSRIRKLLVLAGVSMAFSAAQYVTPVSARAAQSAPDNSKMNKGDDQKDSTTADQQKMNVSDRKTTQRIRAEIMKDKSLSTYAQNVKVITQNGKVTLKGPVRSEDERTNIERKAFAIAGEGNVTNQIEIAPPKS